MHLSLLLRVERDSASAEASGASGAAADQTRALPRPLRRESALLASLLCWPTALWLAPLATLLAGVATFPTPETSLALALAILLAAMAPLFSSCLRLFFP